MDLTAVWIWEKRTAQPEDTSIILSNLKKSTKRIKKKNNGQSFSDQWDNIKPFNRCATGIPEEEERIK